MLGFNLSLWPTSAGGISFTFYVGDEVFTVTQNPFNVTIDAVDYGDVSISDITTTGFYKLADPTIAATTGDGASIGDVLTLTPGLWLTQYSAGQDWQWKDDSVDIGGETATTLTLTSDMISSTITCVETVTDALANDDTATATWAGPVRDKEFDFEDANSEIRIPPGVMPAQPGKMTLATSFIVPDSPTAFSYYMALRGATDEFAVRTNATSSEIATSVTWEVAGGTGTVASSTGGKFVGGTRVILIAAVDRDKGLDGSNAFSVWMAYYNTTDAAWAEFSGSAPMAAVGGTSYLDFSGYFGIGARPANDAVSNGATGVTATYVDFFWMADEALDPASTTVQNYFCDQSGGTYALTNLSAPGTVGGVTPEVFIVGTSGFTGSPPVNSGSGGGTLIKFNTITEL